MRLNVVIAAAFIAAAVFGVANKQSVYANPTSKEVKKETKIIKVNKEASNKAKPEKVKQVIVKPGDYLAKIAKANNTTYIRLYNANPKIKDPDLIYPGQVIKIPGANEKLANRIESKPTVVKSSASKRTPKQSTSKPLYSPPMQYNAGGSVWDKIAQCESGGNWSINTGNGFYGGLQFTLSSWQAVGGQGYPNMASKSEQIYRAKILQSRQGWGAWPACSAALGLR